MSITSTTPGWADADNQVVIFVSQTLAGAMQVVGVSSYPGSSGPGTSGVGFVWAAFSGMTLYELGKTQVGGGSKFYKIEQLLGPTTAVPTVDPPGTGWPISGGFGFPFNSRLMFVGLYVDGNLYPGTGLAGNTTTMAISGADPMDFRHYLRRLRQVNEAQSGSLLFTIGNVPSGATSDVSTTGYKSQNIDSYIDQYDSVARARGCAWLSHHILWGEKGFSMGFQNANDLHPNDAGNQARANDILAVT